MGCELTEMGYGELLYKAPVLVNDVVTQVGSFFLGSASNLKVQRVRSSIIVVIVNG